MLRLRQALLTVIVSIGIFGAMGGGLGALLGNLAPTFVEWMMPHRGYPSHTFDRVPEPDEFALGIGLISGLGFGAFLGILLVVLLAMRDAWVAVWTRGRPEEISQRPSTKPALKPSGLD